MRLNGLGGLLLMWGTPSNKAIETIKERVETNRDLGVLVPEMRPHCFGLEMAKKLKKEGIKHVYATDNMLGILFYKQKVKEVLFFYNDFIDGYVVGICGSLYVCLLAHVHNVPIKPIQGDPITRSVQTASLLDKYMRLQYNDVLEAADEYVPMDIIQ